MIETYSPDSPPPSPVGRSSAGSHAPYQILVRTIVANESGCHVSAIVLEFKTYAEAEQAHDNLYRQGLPNNVCHIAGIMTKLYAVRP